MQYLQQYFAAFTALGYFLGPIDLENDEATFPDENTQEAGVDPALETVIMHFLDGHIHELNFAAYTSARLGAAPNLCFTGVLSTQRQEIGVMTDIEYFRENPDANGMRCYQQWITLLKTVYDVWRPCWGYALGQELGEGPPTGGGMNGIMHDAGFVYTFGNLWEPEFAQQLGYERLATAPVDYYHSFVDGGVLLIPVTHVPLHSPAAGHTSLPFLGAQPVAAHLNLPAHVWPVDLQRYIVDHVLAG